MWSRVSAGRMFGAQGRTCGVLLAGAAVLSLTLSACGGDDESDSDPAPTQSTSSAASTESPSPTKTAKPLSKFEGTPQVKALRKWARLTAKAVNAGEKDFARVSAVTTDKGLGITQKAWEEDLGLRFPGPIPFTPVGVNVQGDTATVEICNITQGFQQNRKTKKPAGKKEIVPVKITMVNQGGWKFDQGYNGEHQCKGVKVKGVKW